MPNSAGIPSVRATPARFNLKQLREATVLLKGIFRTKKLDDILASMVAIGLFIIPHDVAPREILSEAFDSGVEKHNQTLYGLLIIIFGLIGGGIGIALGGGKGKPPDEAPGA